MTLSQWWQIVALYEVILVWPLALFAFLALLRAKTRRGRVMGVSVLFVLFIPFIHRAIGDVYFDYLCEHKAGEFIYRTVDNVEGVLQMRPRDGSKDYFDRMAMGDIPEDPWGHTNTDAQSPWNMLRTFGYVETDASVLPSRYRKAWYDESMFSIRGNDHRFARYFGFDGRSLRSIRKEFSKQRRSEHGYTWKETTTGLQRLLNVRAGELLVVHLESGDVLGRRVGFLRLPSRLACPQKSEEQTEEFLARILKRTRTN